jgi:DNA-binding NtrC family response regulator
LQFVVVMTQPQTDQPLPIVLIVDSDLESRRRTARTLSSHAITRPAPNAATARDALASTPIAGVVLDLALSDGQGMRFLEELRAKQVKLPVLVLSGTDDITEASRVSALKAAFASKRENPADIEARLTELALAAAAYRHARDVLVLGLAERHRLTGAERETLVSFVRRGQRQGLADQLRIAETSLRSRIRGVCRKLEIPRMDAVYRILFEEALGI